MGGHATMSKREKPAITGGLVYWIADKVIAPGFPEVESALQDPDGLLAIGGDLQPERLLDAYRRGIFPWYSDGQPILWWSPDPRCVLFPDAIHISASLRKVLRKNRFRVTFNQAFDQVIRLCAAPRRGRPETWISADIIDAYTELYRSGNILSVECWHAGQLVGGVYGVVIGNVYFGESMFSKMANASKIALVHLGAMLHSRNFPLIDCQVYSAHLQSLGASMITRERFTAILEQHCIPIVKHDWPADSVLA